MAGLLLAFGAGRAPAAGPRSMQEQLEGAQQRMRQQAGGAQERQAEELSQLSARMAAQYTALEDRLERQRAALRARLARQWGPAVEESSEKTWVDYGAQADARSRVDFEKGEVAIEVLVPAAGASGKLSPEQERRVRTAAEEKLRAQARRMLAQPAAPPAEEQAAPPHREVPLPHEEAPPPRDAAPPPRDAAPPLLAGQLRDGSGAAVTPERAEQFVQQLPLSIDPAPVIGTDGKPRLKVQVKAAMIPGHLKVRAGRYAAQVNAQAQKLGVEPALIFAVIQTESSFNPRARSNAGAFGLMQLVPRAAAHEAWRYLHKTDELVTPEFLYDPDNNIELGAAYLQLLQTAYFGKVKSPESRQVLSIASYNCGPSRVRKTVIAGRDLDALTPAQVVGLVRQSAPAETRDYLARVRERMALYR